MNARIVLGVLCLFGAWIVSGAVWSLDNPEGGPVWTMLIALGLCVVGAGLLAVEVRRTGGGK